MIQPEERVLDWKPRFDVRSRNFPISTVVPKGQCRTIRWRSGPVLDQGREGACVGFAWTNEALGTPVAVDLNRAKLAAFKEPDIFARQVYRDAQKIDEWEGEQYEGTSVLAGAKVMQRLGLLREYRWAFTTTDIRTALCTTGPVIAGINWYSGMYAAPDGLLSVYGNLVGGHAIKIPAYAAQGKVFEHDEAFGFFNSWGPTWGTNGFAWMRGRDLARLLSERGEACVPFRRSYGR